MIDSLQPISTSIIATVRRDAVSAVQTAAPQSPQQVNTRAADNQAGQSSNDKNTSNVFNLPPRPQAETQTQQADFVVSSDAAVQAQATAQTAQAAKPPANAFSYANAAYRLASQFTAFPAFSQLNFAV